MKDERLMPYLNKSVSASLFVYKTNEIIYFIVVGDLKYDDFHGCWYVDTDNFETGCAGFKAESVVSIKKLANNTSAALLIEVKDFKE